MRERPRDKARLEHILNACDVIADALVRFGYEPMLEDPILYHGLIKHVEIIGEAVYMLSKEFKSQHPDAEWQAIEDLRHVLVHGYYQINPAMCGLLWKKTSPNCVRLFSGFIVKRRKTLILLADILCAQTIEGKNYRRQIFVCSHSFIYLCTRFMNMGRVRFNGIF